MSIESIIFIAFALIVIVLLFRGLKKNSSKRRNGSYHSGEGSSGYYGDSHQGHGDIGGREGSHGHDHSYDGDSSSGGDSGGGDGGGGNGGGSDGGRGE